MTFHLTSEQCNTIISGLRTASEQYRKDAETSLMHRTINKQFLRQAVEADALANNVEQWMEAQLS